MVAPEPQKPPGRGGLYCTFVPSPHPLKERLLGGLSQVLRLVRPTFRFEGRTYSYFLHAYNRTVRGERCVEIPIVMDWVRAAAGQRVLEIGNVLSHYFPLAHDVVDLYERAPRVANVDVVDFQPEAPYDLVVSVSTLEHVGWDEEPRQPEKLLAALANLAGPCLRPGGRLVMTVPVGYNAFLDEAVATGRIALTQRFYMRRLSRWAHWEQCAAADVAAARYDHPWPFANALLVGVVHKPAAAR
jgi:hypothetical protein